MNDVAVQTTEAEHHRQFVVRHVLAPICASLVVALAARVSFPIPFTPVPFTLQPLAVMGVGLALGPLDGALAMVVYLMEGALGAPVFSATGPGGLLQLLGPTGGFLFAYPAVAALCGGLTRFWQKRFSQFIAAFMACGVATLLLFTMGAYWLGFEAHLSMKLTLAAAVIPFLPGELVKVFAAAGTYRALNGSRLTPGA